MSVGEGSSERDWNQTELRERSKHCSSPPEPQTKAREPAGCQRTTTILDYREKRNTGYRIHEIHHNYNYMYIHVTDFSFYVHV
jgi:hypothetical protein